MTHFLRSIGLHQGAYDAVASPLLVQFAGAPYIFFYTPVTNHNVLLAATQARIHDDTHKR